MSNLKIDFRSLNKLDNFIRVHKAKAIKRNVEMFIKLIVQGAMHLMLVKRNDN